MTINGRYIRGFICPKYDAEKAPVSSGKKSITEIAKEVLAGKWGNGAERQERLAAAGYDPAEVQKLVNTLF